MAPVKDYLDNDPPVRGQNYACLSFLSPEEAIGTREGFAVGKFLSRLAEELSGLLDAVEGVVGAEGDGAGGRAALAGRIAALRERFGYALAGESIRVEYGAFASANASEITREFSEASGGLSCVRGIKIRGCYETMDEARHRCESLRRNDPSFSVYVAEVGCWCPWAPNPDDLAEAAGDRGVAQYAETALNSLMQKYQENADERDRFYQERKSRLMASGRREAGDASESGEHDGRRSLMSEIEAVDAWSERKLAGAGEGVAGGSGERGVGER